MSYSVTQNTTFLTVASVLQKVISFSYFTIIARLIGVGNTGQYFFAISFTTIFSVIADFGLGPVLTREVAKDPNNAERYLNTVFYTKLIFGIIAYALALFAINVLGYPESLKQLVYLSGVTMIFDNLQTAFYSIFRAKKNLIYESISIVGSQIITLVIGSIALFNHWSLLWLIAAYTIPSFLNFLFVAYFLKKQYSLRYRLYFDVGLFKIFIALAVPFALAGIISRLYAYTDSIIISKFLGNVHLGWWSVPYKITFAFQFIPAALSASIYPVMSALSATNPQKIADLFQKSWHYLLGAVLPISIGIYALAPKIIVKLYGEQYAPSAPILRILLVSLIFGFLSFITGALLNATGHPKIQTSLFTVALLVNCVSNIVLLPRLELVGAAISALIGNLVLCFGGLYYSRRFIVIPSGPLFKSVFQICLPALAMGLSVYFLAIKLNFIFTIPLGAIVYILLLFGTGAITLSTLKEMFLKINGKSPSNI